jgi:hypothetical protein
MRLGTTFAAGIGALVLLVPASGTTARTPRLRSCRAVRVADGRAAHVRTTYRCGYARGVLDRLLDDGVGGLPHRGRWKCSRRAPLWTCKRTRPRRLRGRIVFQFTANRPKPQKQPPTSLEPPPVNPLQRCIDLWNGDAVNLATIGYHLAYHHMVTRVWVFEVSNPGATPRCAVIAVVPETDPEFGNDGEVSLTVGGWAQMANVPELGDPADVQRRAAGNANASMLPTGRLTLP